MRARLAMLAMLALAACHRHATADVTLDADQDARNATEAKIDADLSAADAAARAPLPRQLPATPPEARAAPAARASVADSGDADAPDVRESDNDAQ